MKLLDELNTLAERDPALRVLIDESDLAAGFVGPNDIGRIAPFVARGSRVPHDSDARTSEGLAP